MLAFSQDGSRLAAPAVDGTVFVFDVESGLAMRRIAMPPNVPLRDMMFSPDGRVLALDIADGTVTLWEVTTGKKRMVLGERRKEVPRTKRVIVYGIKSRATPENLRFSTDGRRIALVGDGPNVRVWDLLGSKEGVLFEGHQSQTTAAAFSADGKLLVTGGADGTALVWELPELTPPASRDLNGKELEAAWDDLASSDAGKAFEAVRALTGSPKSAVLLFKDRLKPGFADDTVLEKLIADLDSTEFTVRKMALDELERHGPTAAPALKKALKGQLPVGVRKTVEEQLRRAEGALYSEEQLRTLRAVEVLEHTATKQAREMLKSLAKGPASDLLTIHARAALSRLEP